MLMWQSLLMTAFRRSAHETGLVGAAAAPLDGPLFSAEDEVLLGRVAAHFAGRDFEFERDTGQTYDSLWITPAGSINPAWIVVRQHDGQYQLQDGLLCIERQGASLRDVLLPEWLTPLADA